MNDPSDSPIRPEHDALRVRGERVRERSRASLASEHESDGAAWHRQRLLRAEMDLEAAIRECSAALAQVRRELRWTDAGPSPIVH